MNLNICLDIFETFTMFTEYGTLDTVKRARNPRGTFRKLNKSHVFKFGNLIFFKHSYSRKTFVEIHRVNHIYYSSKYYSENSVFWNSEIVCVMICFASACFIIGAKIRIKAWRSWRIKAWGWFPILFLTFGNVKMLTNVGTLDPLVIADHREIIENHGEIMRKIGLIIMAIFWQNMA